MNPQQQAKQLYESMFTNCNITLAGASTIWKPLCKKQCIVAIDLILAGNHLLRLPLSYWQRVKEAINKI